MTPRLKRIGRMVDVQRQMRRLAEAKLADLERRESTLNAERVAIVGALNGDSGLHGLFIDSMARRVMSLSQAILDAETAKQAQAKLALEHARRLKGIERLARDLSRADAIVTARAELAELIDGLRPATASLP